MMHPFRSPFKTVAWFVPCLYIIMYRILIAQDICNTQLQILLTWILVHFICLYLCLLRWQLYPDRQCYQSHVQVICNNHVIITTVHRESKQVRLFGLFSSWFHLHAKYCAHVKNIQILQLQGKKWFSFFRNHGKIQIRRITLRVILNFNCNHMKVNGYTLR